MTKRMPANVSGGRSSRPSLIKSQVEPQMTQRTSHTKRAFIQGEFSRCRRFKLKRQVETELYLPSSVVVMKYQLALRVFKFDNREGSALRIPEYRESTDSRNIICGFHNASSQFG